MVTSGPVHPCPVCDSPDQTCTNRDAPDFPQEEPTVDPPQGPGPLAVYTLKDGTTLKLTESDARRLGLIDEEPP